MPDTTNSADDARPLDPSELRTVRGVIKTVNGNGEPGLVGRMSHMEKVMKVNTGILSAILVAVITLVFQGFWREPTIIEREAKRPGSAESVNWSRSESLEKARLEG